MTRGRRKGSPNITTPERTERVYEAVVAYIERHGYPPTLRELADTLRMAHSNAKYHLDRLAQEGRIVRDPFVSRGIRVVK